MSQSFAIHRVSVASTRRTRNESDVTHVCSRHDDKTKSIAVIALAITTVYTILYCRYCIPGTTVYSASAISHQPSRVYGNDKGVNKIPSLSNRETPLTTTIETLTKRRHRNTIDSLTQNNNLRLIAPKSNTTELRSSFGLSSLALSSQFHLSNKTNAKNYDDDDPLVFCL